MSGNIFEFPKKQSTFEATFEFLKEEGIQEALVIGFGEDKSNPVLAMAGLEDPYVLIALLELSKDTVKQMMAQGVFDDDMEQ